MTEKEEKIIDRLKRRVDSNEYKIEYDEDCQECVIRFFEEKQKLPESE